MLRLLSLFIITLCAVTAHAASFDCKKVGTRVEKMICSSESLSELDNKLNAEYLKALSQACDAKRLRESQLNWLKLRDLGEGEEWLAKTYKEKIEWFISRNTSQTTKYAVVNPTLGKYRFVISPRGCREYRSYHGQTYNLSISDENGKSVQDIDIRSSTKPDGVFWFIDIDGDGYKDLNINRGYGAGPFPDTALYRFNKEKGLFEEDNQFPAGEGSATPAEEPGCVYIEQRRHAGPVIGYDYLITKWCLSRETNTWSEGETCSLAHNKECFQRIDNYKKAWDKKRRDQ